MNPELKAKWVEALRSGEYTQGRGWLCREGKYCCLGVLADLLHELRPSSSDPLAQQTVDGYMSILSPCMLVPIGLSKGAQSWLMAANDRGWSFQDIANAIENPDRLRETAPSVGIQFPSEF